MYDYTPSRKFLDKGAMREFEYHAVAAGLTDFGGYYKPDDAPQGLVLAAYTHVDAEDGNTGEIDVFFTAKDEGTGDLVTEIIIQVEDGIFRSAGVLWGPAFNILNKVVNKRHVIEAQGFDGEVTHYVFNGSWYAPEDYAAVGLLEQRAMAVKLKQATAA